MEEEEEEEEDNDVRTEFIAGDAFTLTLLLLLLPDFLFPDFLEIGEE